jgi:methylated-DNA-[protein]-cysteine S-methyltransferase
MRTARTPATPAYALFDTPIGQCGIAWSERGICALQLPESAAATTRARLLKRVPGASSEPPPPPVRRAMAAIVRLLNGEARDLGPLTVDYRDASEFHRRVCEAARTIPAGQTLTYGELAARLGKPGAARAVGTVMARNALPIIVPCHRVLAAGGRPGGFSAPGGVATKLRMLRLEGAISAE